MLKKASQLTVWVEIHTKLKQGPQLTYWIKIRTKIIFKLIKAFWRKIKNTLLTHYWLIFILSLKGIHNQILVSLAQPGKTWNLMGYFFLHKFHYILTDIIRIPTCFPSFSLVYVRICVYCTIVNITVLSHKKRIVNQFNFRVDSVQKCPKIYSKNLKWK